MNKLWGKEGVQIRKRPKTDDVHAVQSERSFVNLVSPRTRKERARELLGYGSRGLLKFSVDSHRFDCERLQTALLFRIAHSLPGRICQYYSCHSLEGPEILLLGQ